MEKVINLLVQVNLINDTSKIVFEWAFFIFNIKKEICGVSYCFFYFKNIY